MKLQNKNILGYEVYECVNNDVNPRGLIFFQHGYTRTKDDVIDYMKKVAELGFTAVAIDAYEHGVRQTAPLPRDEDYIKEMAFYYHIVVETAKDYIRLFENYYVHKFPSFSMVGESMGGQIIYMVGCKKNELKNIGAIVGSPSLIDYGYEDLIDNHATIDDPNMLDHLSEWDGFYHLDKFKDKHIYMLCGTKDKVVPRKWSQQFKTLMEEQFHTKTIVYEEVERDHWIPLEDLTTLFKYINRYF